MIALTPIAETHLAHVQSHASHPSIGSTSNVPSPYPENGAAIWFALVSARITAGQSEVFAITLDQAFCGVVSLNGISRESGSAELDYWVAVPFQRKGIASRAAALAISHAQQNLGLKSLLSSCLASNTASALVLERNGFVMFEHAEVESGKFQGQDLKRFCLQMPNPSIERTCPGKPGQASHLKR